MENKTLEKTLDTLGNVTKIAANLSETKKDPPKTIPVGDSDNSNKATTGSQNIQLHVDTGKKKEPKPVEKHIHEFPENRPLTEQECELALKKAQMEYELKKDAQNQVNKAMDREWELLRERERKNERKAKIRRIVGGILIAAGIGGLGYSIYADYRDNKNATVAPKALPEGNNINAEGTVN